MFDSLFQPYSWLRSIRRSNRFWKNSRTEKHDDPLNTDPPAPAPAPAQRRGCVCEFCGCSLAPSGEIIKVGDSAKRFRKHEETIEKKDEEITRLNSEITKLKEELAALRNPSPAASSGHRLGARVTSS